MTGNQWIGVWVSVGISFCVGMIAGRPAEQVDPIKASQQRVDSRLDLLEMKVRRLDETLVYERARLDEMRQKVQTDREATIRCCEARP